MSESQPSSELPTPPASSSPTDVPTADELRKALKAFKKRLKLARLDDESRLGRGAMTGGKASGIVAIMAPHQYRKAIWETLVEQGRLKPAGRGLYELVKQ